MYIDLNCDMAEGLANDAELMPYISSANIACGYHAGDEDTMKHTVALAIQHHVSIGAHPGFADRENFGRKEMHLPAQVIRDLITEQFSLLQKITKEFGAHVHHIKPHGALYNMSAKDELLARTIAETVYTVDPNVLLVGLSGSHSITEAKKLGLRAVSEVFADRTYQSNGALTPRTQPNAMIETEEASVGQVLQMINDNTVTSIDNKRVPIVAETVCLHGDGAHAVRFAKKIFHSLQQQGIGIKSF